MARQYVSVFGHTTDEQGDREYVSVFGHTVAEQIVAGGASVSPASGTLTYTGSAPTITALFEVNPTQGALSYTGFQPTISTDVGDTFATVTPTQGILTYSGQAPQITTTIELGPTLGTLTYTGEQPKIVATVAPQAVLFAYTGQTPTITFYSEITISPTTGILTYSGAEASIGIGGTVPISPTQATLTYIGGRPTFSRTWIGWTEVEDAAGIWDEILDNLLNYSETLSNSVWNVLKSTVIESSDRPDYLQDAYLWTDQNDLGIPGFHTINQSSTEMPDGINTFSVYAKANTFSRIKLVMQRKANIIRWSTITANLDNGTITANTGALESYGIKDAGDEWYRIWIVGDILFGELDGMYYVEIVDDNGDSLYSGDGTGSIYIGGLQVVVGSEKGAYQKTTALPSSQWTEKTDDSTTWSKL